MEKSHKTETEADPQKWIETNVPTTTISGIQVAYVENEIGYRMQYFSIDWLAEEFRSQITTSSNPCQSLAQACEKKGYETLKTLFSGVDVDSDPGAVGDATPGPAKRPS